MSARLYERSKCCVCKCLYISFNVILMQLISYRGGAMAWRLVNNTKPRQGKEKKKKYNFCVESFATGFRLFLLLNKSLKQQVVIKRYF